MYFSFWDNVLFVFWIIQGLKLPRLCPFSLILGAADPYLSDVTTARIGVEPIRVAMMRCALPGRMPSVR